MYFQTYKVVVAVVVVFLLHHCDSKAPYTPCNESEYELIGSGYCSDHVFLKDGRYPPLLSHANPLFDDDRVQECMNRCLHDNPKCEAFYLKDYELCACAFSNCSSQLGSSSFTSYRIVSNSC